MAGFLISIETDSKSADAVFDRLRERLSPPGLALFLQTVVDPFIRQRVSDRFDSEGDDASGNWHPLAQATRQIRAAYGFPPDHPINVRTNKMRSWLVSMDSEVLPSGVGATLQHPPISADPVMQKKIATAQSGSNRPATRPRPVIGVNENDLIFVTSSLAAWISQDFI